MFVLASELSSACPHVMIRELLKGFSRSGTFITNTVLAKVEQRTDVLLEAVYVLLILARQMHYIGAELTFL
jgi:hypothetical protein